MKKRDILIIIIFLLIAAFFVWLFWNDLTQTLSVRDQEPVGTLVIKKNVVQRRFGDRNLWDRLRTESPVYIGNLIRVPEASSAILYIKDNSIALDENTLIRITLSPDGEIQIDLSGGSVSVIADENSQGILLNLNGEVYRVNSGTVLSASLDNESSSLQYLLSADEVLNREHFAISENAVNLRSPAVNSVYRYNETLPVIHFSWTELEQALSYILQVSGSEDFSDITINRETSSVSFSASLQEGTWYWRVMPVFPALYAGIGNYSGVSNFSVEKSGIPLAELEQLSFADWLNQVIGNSEQGTDNSDSEQVTENSEQMTENSEQVTVLQPNPAPRPQPSPRPQLTPPAPVVAETSPLTPPIITTPMNNLSFGREELQDRREIIFTWSPVEEAEAYVFILYQQTETGTLNEHEERSFQRRRQIVRTSPSNTTSYTLSNFRELENGNYIWQVEAISTAGGVERRVTTAEQTFILNIPLPTPVQPREIGIQYD